MAASVWADDSVHLSFISQLTTSSQENHPMTRDDILNAIREASVEVLSVEADQVTETASFADDLEADSLDLVELVMAVEDRLNVEIGEEDLSEIRTVADAVALVQNAVGAAA
jgi:acyl carrier protein